LESGFKKQTEMSTSWRSFGSTNFDHSYTGQQMAEMLTMWVIDPCPAGSRPQW